MARVSILIGSLLAAFSFSGHAAYVSLKPPSGWSQGTGAGNTFKTAGITGSDGKWLPGVSTTGQGIWFNGQSSMLGTTMGQSIWDAALTVAGTPVSIPTVLRVAPGAAKIAAELAFGTPALLVTGAVILAPIAYKWFTDQKFSIGADGQWKKEEEVSQIQYQATGSTVWYSSQSAACEGWGVRVGKTYPSSVFSYSVTFDDCRETAEGDVVRTAALASRTGMGTELKPVPLAEFVSKMAPLKVPVPMFREYPGYVEWPVELPYIDPLTDEESTSFGRPYLVPTGLPFPSPDALSWIQPAVRVTPAPTPSTPWRVDAQPVNVPQPTSTPKTPEQLNPKPVTTIDPVTGLPTTTKPDTGTPVNPGEPPPGLCVEFPDILACQKLGAPDVPELVTQNQSIVITPDSGWTFGPGQCPADRISPRSGFVIASFQPACDFMSGLKPVVIAMAWLAAAMIVLGLKGSES